MTTSCVGDVDLKILKRKEEKNKRKIEQPILTPVTEQLKTSGVAKTISNSKEYHVKFHRDMVKNNSTSNTLWWHEEQKIDNTDAADETFASGAANDSYCKHLKQLMTESGIGIDNS